MKASRRLRSLCSHGHLRIEGNIRYERGQPVCKACRQEQYQRLKAKIMNPTIPFRELNEGPQTEKTITPLGAAIVEALPDQARVKHIKARFEKGICPPSALFSPSQVVQFYRNCNIKIVAEPPSQPDMSSLNAAIRNEDHNG